MDYQEFPPGRPLAPMVDRLWTLTGDAGELDSPLQPVLPDGRPELILHFGDPFERAAPDGGCDRQPAILFAGQLLRELILRPTGRVAVVGVRFRPFGLAGLVDMPQHELTGHTIGIDAVSPSLHRELTGVMSDARTVAEAVRRVQTWLIGRIDSSRIDPRIQLAVGEIARRRGRVSIDFLSRRTNLTRRHLDRRFLHGVGVTPKRLARIVRFQHALSVLERCESAPGTQAAAACGFADQAHFIRDFRALAGRTPSEHLVRQAVLTGFFIDRDPGPAA